VAFSNFFIFSYFFLLNLSVFNDPDKANSDSKGTQPVGSYPEGASPYGVLDLVGNVWEMTDSFQSDGYHCFSWLRGGSFYFAKGTRWYMQGGR
jgi:formylglycine-generating enzyme required for sulfatase activity